MHTYTARKILGINALETTALPSGLTGTNIILSSPKSNVASLSVNLPPSEHNANSLPQQQLQQHTLSGGNTNCAATTNLPTTHGLTAQQQQQMERLRLANMMNQGKLSEVRLKSILVKLLEFFE